MASSNSLNWDQHSMTEGHVRSLFSEKDRREVVTRALKGARMIGIRGNNHVKIFVEGDGIVTIGNTGRGRASANIESDLRRAHRSVGRDFPRSGESDKQFERRMQRQKEQDNGQHARSTV